MRNIKFLDEPGFIYDLFFLFSFNFNKDYCLTNFINYSKSSEDTDYYCKILNEFSPISDDLLLFFYFTEDKKNLITKYYYEPYKASFVFENYDLSTVQEELSNYEKVKENIIRFYFKDINEESVIKCKDSITYANRLIKNSPYNGEIKSALYSFFIEPETVIHKLSYELMEKSFALSQKYDAKHKLLSELKDNFNFDFVLNQLMQTKNRKGDFSCFDNIYVTFCLYHKNCVKTHYYSNEVVILLGVDYIEHINYLTIQFRLPELENFGNAISESNRVSILNLIYEKDEITIKDLEQEFGFTGTNAYYHLSLMIKAGMLKTRNRGRTILYSINKQYFQTLCGMLEKYYKERGDQIEKMG